MKNFREICYKNMKPGLLFRSDLLYHLNPKEKALLRDNNIKVVIDLRNKDEVEHLKDTNIKAIKFINNPMLPESKGGEDSPLKTVTIKHMTLPDMDNAYRELVRRDRQSAWSNIFNILLADNGGAILYHCSAGKDRTGVVTAVILTALGIDKETIYQDYLLTNEKPLYYKKMALQMDPESREIFLDYFQAKKEYLDASFDEINKIYGSFDKFLLECCLIDNNKLAILKDKYLK